MPTDTAASASALSALLLIAVQLFKARVVVDIVQCSIRSLPKIHSAPPLFTRSERENTPDRLKSIRRLGVERELDIRRAGVDCRIRVR